MQQHRQQLQKKAPLESECEGHDVTNAEGQQRSPCNQHLSQRRQGATTTTTSSRRHMLSRMHTCCLSNHILLHPSSNRMTNKAWNRWVLDARQTTAKIVTTTAFVKFFRSVSGVIWHEKNVTSTCTCSFVLLVKLLKTAYFLRFLLMLLLSFQTLCMCQGRTHERVPQRRRMGTQLDICAPSLEALVSISPTTTAAASANVALPLLGISVGTLTASGAVHGLRTKGIVAPLQQTLVATRVSTEPKLRVDTGDFIWKIGASVAATDTPHRGAGGGQETPDSQRHAAGDGIPVAGELAAGGVDRRNISVQQQCRYTTTAVARGPYEAVSLCYTPFLCFLHGLPASTNKRSHCLIVSSTEAPSAIVGVASSASFGSLRKYIDQTALRPQRKSAWYSSVAEKALRLQTLPPASSSAADSTPRPRASLAPVFVGDLLHSDFSSTLRLCRGPRRAASARRTGAFCGLGAAPRYMAASSSQRHEAANANATGAAEVSHESSAGTAAVSTSVLSHGTAASPCTGPCVGGREYTRRWAGCCGGGAAMNGVEPFTEATDSDESSNADRSSNSCDSKCSPAERKAAAARPTIPRVGSMVAGPRPDWFHVPAPQTTTKGETTRFELLQQQIRGLKLHTVCEEAKCPNIGECWNGGTATLMLLGDTCTRGCRFCAIKTSGKPPPPDPHEPEKVAAAVAKWDVDYLVLTSVDRDDLPDGGAQHFARTVRLLKQVKPRMLVECLVPDFQGAADAIRTLACSGLDVYAHNVETVCRLTPFVRDKRANYRQSLRVLQLAKQLNPLLYTKSSIMVGLGETADEVFQTLKDLRAHEVDVVTFGQYLRPTKQQLGVVEYVTPQTFQLYRRAAEEMGFKYVASGPLVRSSYKAGEYYMKHLLTNQQRGDASTQPSGRVKLKANVDMLKTGGEESAVL